MTEVVEASGAGLWVLDRAYLLVTGMVMFRDDEGSYWIADVWHHDLMEHLRYLKNLTLCAPTLDIKDAPLYGESIAKGFEVILVRIEAPGRLRYVELPFRASLFKALLVLPRSAAILWRAIGGAEIVHSAIVGHPYPLGWIVNPFAAMRGKRLVVVVESPWRREETGGRRWKSKIWNLLSESFARWSCKRADVAFFTQPGYRDLLHRSPRGTAYITPAIWINETDILEQSAAAASWAFKMAEPVRLLFAGRLTDAKGVRVLLAALRLLDQRGSVTHVDIIGQGDLLEHCEQAAGSMRSVRLSISKPVRYGEPFFAILRQYHALLLPSLSDEQPRVVFDANSQAVPVLGSNTFGVRSHIENGRTGWLLPPGDEKAWAAAIEQASQCASELRDMGMQALAAAHGHTHAAMHRARSQILHRHFG